VINAGDGQHEHPTQGLLDLYTMRERLGDLSGVNVTIIGDVLHSRVARSNIWGLTKLGAVVTVCGPGTVLPHELEALGVRRTTRIEDAIADARVVMVLRLQFERMHGGYIPTIREYARQYGLTRERAERLRPDVIIMHPGPINRGVEIEPEVADGPNSVILDQVKNGVAVRMAVLYLLSGRRVEEMRRVVEEVPA
jgi:aspartate carbamoyltransferase catalytic subunit